MWTTNNILLGFVIDTKSEEIAIPSEKIYGAKLMVEAEDFDPGRTIPSLKSVQTLRGLSQHWINASVFGQAVIQLIDALLGYADETAQVAKYSDAEILEGWWGMMTFVRYLSSREDVWPCLFRNRMKKLLGLTKRLSGEAMAESVIWTSGGATPSSIAGVNWTNNQYLELFPCDVSQEFPNRQQGNNLIAECELADVVAIVITWTGPQSTSRLILNGSDNTNVLSWIRKRKASNRAAYRMLNCLHMWCIKYDIDLYGTMVRSMHNVPPDLLTRASQAEMEEWEKRMKMKRVSGLPNLKLFAECLPHLNGPMKEGETLDLGRLQPSIGYWGGLVVECDPFEGVIHRWAEGTISITLCIFLM